MYLITIIVLQLVWRTFNRAQSNCIYRILHHLETRIPLIADPDTARILLSADPDTASILLTADPDTASILLTVAQTLST